MLRERQGVVRTVHRAVAGAADGDGPVQHGVGVALLAVALVRAPGEEMFRGGRGCAFMVIASVRANNA